MIWQLNSTGTKNFKMYYSNVVETEFQYVIFIIVIRASNAYGVYFIENYIALICVTRYSNIIEFQSTLRFSKLSIN